MQASETKLQSILEGTKQYIVPLFQRLYTWKKKEWGTLWKDIAELSNSEKPSTHFIGSIVTMPTDSAPESVNKFVLIDGQQRMATIFILLAALRDLAREKGEDGVAEEINNTLLVNPYKKDLDYFKLLPTQGDRDLFKAIVLSQSDLPTDALADAYQFFKEKIRSSGIDHNALKTIITNGLSIVSIVLDPDDNPYLVFESLNAKGQPLTQADLIRNYFFMRIHPDKQDEAHTQFWKPMQDAMGDKLTELIRHYLMKGGTIVRTKEIYAVLKEQVGKGDAIEHLKDLARFADFYERLLHPEREKSGIISRGLVRLNRCDVTTAYPFLLNCYDQFEAGVITEAEFGDVLRVVENYVIRRYICNVPTNQLNKIFSPLYRQVMDNEGITFVDRLKNILQGKGYPKDAEFRSDLVVGRLYGGGDRTPRAKLVLETIEGTFQHKESVDMSMLSIEHVMPQTLTPEWREYLGEDAVVTHELSLHTLGNLTLTGYNSELSNDAFDKKKKYLASSHLEMNKYFENVDTWNGVAIESRSQELADVLIGYWNYFGPDIDIASAARTDGVVKRGVPASLEILGQKILVTSWKGVWVETLNTIAHLEPEKFDTIKGTFPSFITHDASRFRRSHNLSNGLFIQVNLSAQHICNVCLRVLKAAELTSGPWIVRDKNSDVLVSA